MLLNQMKASLSQFYNVRVQISQCCEVAEMLSQFCDEKRTHMQQSLEQIKLPDSVMINLKVQLTLPLLMMPESEMLLFLFIRLGLN